MKTRTTINPRTTATAKTPKSATEKCEGSIVGKNQQLIRNVGTGFAPSGKWCVLCLSPPVTQRFQVHPGSSWVKHTRALRILILEVLSPTSYYKQWLDLTTSILFPPHPGGSQQLSMTVWYGTGLLCCPRGGTPLYGLYRYVRPQRVWFFSHFGHKFGIDFSHFAAILVVNRVSIFAL